MNFAIILAAGQSKRTKNINKLFFKIRGKPLIFYTIRAFEKHPLVNKIVLVVRKKQTESFYKLIKKYGLKKVSKMVGGGKERQDSAFAGLKAAEGLSAKKNDMLLFHNGANPLVAKKDIHAAIKAAQKHKAVVVGQLTKDTVKKINKNGLVIKTLDRKNIFLAQTPQVIEYSLAKKAFTKARKSNYKGTDDVVLVERLGKPVKTILCSAKNIKITTKEDLKTLLTIL